MQLEVINFRPYTKGATLGFFDIAIDQTFVVRGFALKRKNDGTGYYWQAPSKKRLKNGQPVKDDKGFDVYDAHFDLYGEKDGDGNYKVAKTAFEGRTELINLAVAAYSASQTAESGRGPERPATVATAVEGAGEGEDDLPF